MRNELERHHHGAAIPRDLGGTETAAARGKDLFAKTLRRFAGFIIVLTVIGVASFQPAVGDDPNKKPIPTETSTIPANGDNNPYGVAFVPDGFPKGGKTAAGDILVSNFNAKSTVPVQGTGTTIVSISPGGTQNLFFQGTPPSGLTTALNVLKKGFSTGENVPTNRGRPQQGAVIALHKDGNHLPGPR